MMIASAKGKIDPLAIEDWRDYIKLHILESMRNGAKTLDDIVHGLCDFNGTRRLIQLRFKHEMEKSEVESIILEMYRDGLITPAEYVCECCRNGDWPDKDVLKHVIAFRPT